MQKFLLCCVPFWAITVSELQITYPPCLWNQLSGSLFHAAAKCKSVIHFQHISHMPVHLCHYHFNHLSVLCSSTEVKREYYQTFCVLDCVTQCSLSTAHGYEQFLQVKQIGFVILGPLRCA